MEEDILVDIVNNIIESRIKSILEIINANYPDKFDKKLIKTEYEYIKNHIVLEKANTNDYQNKICKSKRKNIIKLKQIKPKDEMQDKMKSTIPRAIQSKVRKSIDLNIQCSGRVWSDYIFNKQTMKNVNDIESKYKVNNYKNIDLQSFTEKYIIGSRCINSQINGIKYCKLHSKHLIHGDYLEIPTKELCYHFIKDGKYL